MRGGRALVLALLALLGGAAVLRADYKESYRKGITAKDRREWGEVARWMRQAAGEQSREGEQVKIYGVRFEAYLPHYYLGLALSQNGDCEGALAQWQESEKQGAVQAAGLAATMAQSREVCRQRVAASGTPPPAPRAAPAAAPAAPDPAAQARATEGAEAEERRQAQFRQTARDREAADKLAEETRHQQEAAKTEALRQANAQKEGEKQEAARRQELARQLSLGAGEARKILGQAAARPTPALQAQQAALRELLRQAGAAGPATPLADLDRLQREIPAATARLAAAQLTAQETKGGPPAELRAAVRAFFRADYREVVRALATASLQERRERLTGSLLLAAAHYALYLQSGEKDAALRALALEKARLCRQLDPRLVPDPRVFSPRFTEFFHTAG